MATISARLQNENYRVEITSPSGNVLISDEPESLGGKNSGFSPDELLASSLAACTSATVRMYAERKDWALSEVRVHVDLQFNKENLETTIHREVTFIGELDEAQRARLLAIANLCPIHKILSNTIRINTEMS